MLYFLYCSWWYTLWPGVFVLDREYPATPSLSTFSPNIIEDEKIIIRKKYVAVEMVKGAQETKAPFSGVDSEHGKKRIYSG